MKVLLVQTSFLGDTVLSTAVISGLRRCMPDAEIWMMTTPVAACLVESDPALQGVISFDKRGEHSGLRGILKIARRLRKAGFDRVYSLHRSIRTAVVLFLAGIPDRVGFSESRGAFLYSRTVKRTFPGDTVHDVIRNLRILSADFDEVPEGEDLRLSVPAESVLSPTIRRFLEMTPEYAVLVPGSVWKTKRWSAQGYREVGLSLIKQGFSVVVIGSARERAVCQVVSCNTGIFDFSGKTSLQEVVRLIDGARVVVCNDSFAQHVCSALKTPNVVVFCATSPAFGFGPWRNHAFVVEKSGLSCKPCRRHGGHSCPTGTEACMNELSSSEVISAIQRLLSSPGREDELVTIR